MSASEFAYFPADPNLATRLADAGLSRLVALGSGVPDVVEHVGETRWLAGETTELAVGTYVFDGIEESLALYVPLGGPPSDTTRVAVAELSDDHPLAEAWRWAEHWWEQAAPVPSPRFGVLENVLQVASGIEVRPAQRRFAGGSWTYKVTVDGLTRWEPESALVPSETDDDPMSWVQQAPANVDRFAATLTRAKLTGRFSDTLYSFGATRTTFLPYQFKPVLKLLETGKDRLLIADEVGLGKTIEAGLVWTEMEARGQADRVLVVCPSSLVGKWQQEMEERFGFELEELASSRLDSFLTRHFENRLPPRFRYVTSIERLRSWQGLEPLAASPPDLDLVIVDEAHSMRNLGTKSNKMGALLQDWSSAIIFLTATPINLHEQDLYNLLDLLVPEDMGDFEDLIARLQPNATLNQVGRMLTDPNATPGQRVDALRSMPATQYGAYVTSRPDYMELLGLVGKPSLEVAEVVEARRLIAGLNTLSTVITRTKKRDVMTEKAIREPRWSVVEWTEEESRFYSEYVSWCKERADAVGMPVHFAQQMPLRLASACLPMARKTVLDWSPGMFDSDDESNSRIVDDLSPSRLVEPHRELREAAEALASTVDTKFDKLLPVIEAMVAEGRQTLLFTFSRPTLAYLHNRLRTKFRIAQLHGGVDREGRRRIMAEFREGRYDLVLASKVASEGLDFEFCSAIINYDLPWNPMEVEQRIGRIDRIGQKADKLLVASFRNDATIDERIVARVLERIQIFDNTIGELEPIIAAQMDLLVEAFNSELTEDEKDRKVDQFLQAVEENRAGLKDVADASTSLIVGNDVDVSGLRDDLERTGRYVGQRELATLLDDWAITDHGSPVEISPDGNTLTLRGNAEMAQRVTALSAGRAGGADAQGRRRSAPEVEPYAARLRSGIEMHFAIDQEFARTTGHDLLTANNPLVMAATRVPGRSQARFTHAVAQRHDESVPVGTYVVVVASATFEPRGDSELWASAVTLNGQEDDGPIATALLSAIARGALGTPTLPLPLQSLPQLAEVAMDGLHARHAAELSSTRSAYVAMAELRRQTMLDQHTRKVESIQRRIATALSRGSLDRSVLGFRGMETKANERFADLIVKLDNEPAPTIALTPVAACVLEVIE